MMDLRTLRILIGVFVTLQFIVLCQALNVNDKGVCTETVSIPKTKYQRINIKRKCPPKFLECLKKDRKNLPHFDPKKEKCCYQKYTVFEKQPSCCPGWEYHEKDKTCRAQCKLGCLNGNCTAPDVCECDPPLILVNNECITPVCDHPCINGFCAANNTCECEPGFNKYNETHCSPTCELGYENDHLTLNCIPKCDSPCLNSTCTGPNICTCEEGYKHKDDFTCIPECTPECVNADCVASNTCSCFEGYSFNSTTICHPVCEDGCDNGDCIEPNVCMCQKGYEKKNETCVPICKQPCNNGICSAPDVCMCKTGYEKDHKNPFDCVPICDKECQNASCVLPNTCVCYEGFESAGNDWTCAPVCDLCEHGDCVNPNECNCHQGYSEHNGTCRPKCDEPCVNGYCFAPNKCQCEDGYKIYAKDKFFCAPKCDEPCVNATCTDPNSCSCLEGYTPTEDKNVCQPKCDSCTNGKCVAPNTCLCNDGYENIDGKCYPKCYEPCVNAECVFPNNCKCKEGFHKDPTSTSICCRGPCENGACSSDGMCQCDPGFELHNDTCTAREMSYTSISCSNCEYNCSEGDCWCFDGRPCIEPSVEAESTTGLAGVELTWTLAGSMVLLLTILIIGVMHRLYRRRKEIESKDDIDDGNRLGSIVYTLPDRLMHRNEDEDLDTDDEKQSERLLTPEVTIKDEKL